MTMTTRFAWLTVRHLREHFESLMMDDCYFEQRPDTWRLRIANAVEVARRTVVAVYCELRGHDLEAETFAPESGGESLSCKRCGWSVDVWH